MVVKMSENKKIAIILIRGMVNISPDVKKTLELLRLKQKHACVVIDDNEVSRGMIQRVKDYTTYGTIDEPFFKEMLDKRGEMVGKIRISKSKEKIDTAKIAKEYFSAKMKLRDFESKGIKPFFRLAPPIKGFERKGIKMPFAKGGVLGQRGDAIKDLIVKML
jgi:large subunit ribosomal protein L30